ncbi:MAG: phage regulatory CII family protein [Planctomycetota bacterium]|jgi:hypothetical protein
MDSYEVLKEAVDRVGAKKVAAQLQVSTSLVYKWCEAPSEEIGDEKSGARNPLDRIDRLIEATGDTGALQWLCDRADGFFVANPKTDKVNLDADFIANTQRMISEFSELLQVVSASMADDGKVDAKEAKQIRREWQDLKSYAEAFVHACEEGAFDPR